ncbi:MAG: tRNA (adenosine(37)-N6)-dimethylallyltransferase MiaA, partial [Clostridia bacterium]|nr:tRNA (adenosine(37)-N6)-dimethylallyltransferase MiaA [Clostridia bacterium]
LSEPILKNLLNNGKVTVICGGTGFYIKSLLFNFGYGNTAGDNSLREKYQKFAEECGNLALHKKLEEVDPQAAEKLHENDIKRVIRALEIYELSGKKKSEQNDKQMPNYNYVAVAVDYPREELYERINKRVDEMFEAGLVNEVEMLLSLGIDENCQCMQAIGYKEVLACLKNGDLQSTMRDIIKQNTRRYAKRQITFFKKLPNIIWLKPEEATAERVLEILYEPN